MFDMYLKTQINSEDVRLGVIYFLFRQLVVCY